MSTSIAASVDRADSANIRLDFLDGLRALAAIFVVLHHGWLEIWDKPGEGPRWTHWLHFGNISVDVFIVLSGFCLMLPVVRVDGILRGGALSFFRRRARRILPPYYFALALSLLLIFTLAGKVTGTQWDLCLPVTWHSVVLRLMLLQNAASLGIFKVNYAFWSIGVEWWIYFLFPLLVWLWRRFGAGASAALSVIVSIVLCGICRHQFHGVPTLYYVMFSAYAIMLFVFGMLGAELAYTRNSKMQMLRDRLSWKNVTWIMAAATVFILSVKIPHFPSAEPLADTMAGLLTLCFLITLCIYPEGTAARILSVKPLVFLGSFAYSIYLIHAPLIQVFWQYVLHPLHLAPVPTFLLLEILGTPMIIACAYLFFLACERPFMNVPGKAAPRTERETETAAIVNPAP